MNDKQEALLARIKTAFIEKVDPKFRLGDQEHEGDLSDVDEEKLNDYSMEEAIDLFVYLYTQSLKLKKREKYIKELEATIEALQGGPTSLD